MADQFDAYIIDRHADTKRPSEGWKSVSADELMEGDVTVNCATAGSVAACRSRSIEPWRGRISGVMAQRFWGG